MNPKDTLPTQDTREVPRTPAFQEVMDYVHVHGPLEYVIALGHNWDLTENWQQAELSLPSKITALTSYLLLEQGLVKKVIFSGGKTAGPEKPSESEAMLDYLKVLFGKTKIDAIRDRIILEEKSYSTYSNFKESEKEMEGLAPGHLQNVGLMSIGYHMAIRAEPMAKSNHLPVDLFMHSDDLLKDLLVRFQSNPDLDKAIFGDAVDDIESVRLRTQVANLVSDYQKYLESPIYKDDEGKLKLAAHTPIYHQLASVFQFATRDKTGEKIDEKAKARLTQGKI